MKPSTARFAILTIAAAVVLGFLLYAGLAQQPFVEDATWMSRLSGVLTIIGMFFVWKHNWGAVRWIANSLPYIGLVGTTIGLVILSRSLDSGGSFENAKGLLASGIGPALFPNLTAAVGYIFLSFLARVLGNEDV